MIKNTKQFFRRYSKILDLKASYDIELYDYLRKYMDSHSYPNRRGYILDHTIAVNLKDRLVWNAEIYYGGGEPEIKSFSVSLDYFDNPEQYITREQELNRIAAEEKKERERLKVIESEKEMLAKLKEKYEND